MPYIHMQTSCAISADQRTALFKMLNETISLIPGKTPNVTMIQIDDHCTMQRAEDFAPCIFFELRMFKASPEEAKALYVKTVSEKLSDLLGVDQTRIYMNLMEFQTWGSGGIYKS